MHDVCLSGDLVRVYGLKVPPLHEKSMVRFRDGVANDPFGRPVTNAERTFRSPGKSQHPRGVVHVGLVVTVRRNVILTVHVLCDEYAIVLDSWTRRSKTTIDLGQQ